MGVIPQRLTPSTTTPNPHIQSTVQQKAEYRFDQISFSRKNYMESTPTPRMESIQSSNRAVTLQKQPDSLQL
jgi:hypothetical protein